MTRVTSVGRPTCGIEQDQAGCDGRRQTDQQPDIGLEASAFGGTLESYGVDAAVGADRAGPDAAD